LISLLFTSPSDPAIKFSSILEKNNVKPCEKNAKKYAPFWGCCLIHKFPTNVHWTFRGGGGGWRVKIWMLEWDCRTKPKQRVEKLILLMLISGHEKKSVLLTIEK